MQIPKNILTETQREILSRDDNEYAQALRDLLTAMVNPKLVEIVNIKTGTNTFDITDRLAKERLSGQLDILQLLLKIKDVVKPTIPVEKEKKG